ncbi:probable F-box protein At4g22165 [Arachis stenosperma]|uniref:probable F-box protein At4g22165 n=1 Tax=Arachis stenosperma TaxID=217475 RepID=UPI0025ABB0FD|nr:probable F-box protein At4g22165 [Arachis stenosperma]
MGDDIDGWANIHDDILKEIAEHFYSYDDFIQLRLVCKQWSLKLPEISSEILWLLVPEESSSTRIYEDEEIYHLMNLPIADEVPLDIQSLDEDEIHHLKLPEMQNKLIRGSFGGWLIVLDIYQGSMYMLNAFTKVRLDLPPISTFPDIIDYNPNNYGFEYTIRDLDDENKDDIHLAIYGPRCTLAFYKPNDKRWLDLSTRKPSFHDVIFFGEKIYAVDEDGQLYEFDTNTKSGPVGGIHEAKPPSDAAVGPYQLKYLVGCANGSLLMLARHFMPIWKALRFKEVVELLTSAADDAKSLIDASDRLVLYIEIARLYGNLGYQRKAAFFSRKVAQLYLQQEN